MYPQTPSNFGCVHCGRSNFASANALRQHQKKGFCSKVQQNLNQEGDAALSPMSWANEAEYSDQEGPDCGAYMPYLPEQLPRRKQPKSRLERADIEPHDVDAMTTQIGAFFDENGGSEDESDDNAGCFDYMGTEFGADGAESCPGAPSSDDESDDSTPSTFEAGDPGTESGANAPEAGGPNTWIRGQFQEYCAYAQENFIPFNEHEEKTVRLLHLLKEKNSPMNAYEPMMLWHLKEAKLLREHQTLQDYPHFIGRKTMIKRLVERYNFANKMPRQKALRLPVSGSLVRLTVHDCAATIQRLLTDPRLRAKDYLLWDRDPLAPPPEKLNYVQDLNTGLAYTETYEKLVTKEGQQLMPILIYSDGTAVSHFHDMELIQVNIALGTLTREARNQPHCWAPLGYIEKVHEHGGRGKTILEEANHVETQDGAESLDSGESWLDPDVVGQNSAQDFHAMMAVILEPFVGMQEHGLLWDHQDPIDGTLHQDIHYLLFVPFCKADSKEADLFCGKYAQRHSAQQICRKCHIPLQQADDHLAKHKLKTVREIQKLVQKANLSGLKALSQTYLTNAFHKVRFSMGNDQGIHGSCPSELLHAFLLGTFKYLRDIFFEMIGNESEGARLMNALAKVYGKLFSRQSDRTLPGTAFSRGIQVGKLMAKDYRGVLLIMLAMLRSTRGRAILNKYRSFKEGTHLDDWILLVEVMLEWESYLNEPLMQMKHVKRMDRKNRYIMYVMRKVARRSKGMGLKLTKFHMILHIWEDIIQFGVPLEFDTSANESMHKPSKKASKMTQKAADTFNLQTATRLIEFELLDLAMEEINNDRVPWNYYQRREDSGSEEDDDGEDAQIWTGETGIKVGLDVNTGEVMFELSTRSKFAAKTSMNLVLLEFLNALQDVVHPFMDTDFLPIFTCHRRKGQTFRGHPNYRGKGPWRDWVWVNWGPQEGRLPCQIWCFVTLSGMPQGRNRLQYGGVRLDDGVFAVVEHACVENSALEVGKSDLMMPVMKEVGLNEDGLVENRTFSLADTEAFEDPCCVIPDLGGPPNRYFVVKPRNQWAKEFVRWLEDPHQWDDMDEPLDDVEDNDETTGKVGKVE